MTDDTLMDKFDPLRLAGLRRKKKPRPDGKYGSFNRRMMAATVDSLLFTVLTPLFNVLTPIDHAGLSNFTPAPGDPLLLQHALLAVLGDRHFVASWANNLTLQALVFFVFSGLCWRVWGATPGKMLLRLKVVDAETDAPISDRQIVLRLVGYVVSTVFVGLGFFWIAFDRRRQGWHDKIAGTTVIIASKAKSGSAAANPSDSPAPSSAE